MGAGWRLWLLNWLFWWQFVASLAWAVLNLALCALATTSVCYISFVDLLIFIFSVLGGMCDVNTCNVFLMLFMVLCAPIFATLCRRAVLTLWHAFLFLGLSFFPLFFFFAWWPYWLQKEHDEHRHGKWEGKQKGKSDKRITETKARQKESTTLCTHLADQTKETSRPRRQCNKWRQQAAPHAPLEEARGRLRPMARVKSAVAGKGISTEEEAAAAPSAAADKPRKTLSA
jgi:hypothetical protein